MQVLPAGERAEPRRSSLARIDRVSDEPFTSLGLNSKRDIEAYGLAEFADRCIERVAQYSELITEQSRRLGMWMDWANSYYTFSDTNNEYIWRFLEEVHRRSCSHPRHPSS